jgi:5-methylcytosine-specific restriction endonuclease McrA
VTVLAQTTVQHIGVLVAVLAAVVLAIVSAARKERRRHLDTPLRRLANRKPLPQHIKDRKQVLIAELDARRREQDARPSGLTTRPVRTTPPVTEFRREPIPQRVRDQVYRRDQYRCVECGSQWHLER